MPTKPLITKLLTILGAHHSKDVIFLKAIGQLRYPPAEAMETAYGPWRCRDCRRMCKATSHFCPSCGQEWAKCADKSYAQEAPSYSWAWENPKNRPGPAGRSTSRARSSSERRRWKANAKKGKGKGKEGRPAEAPKEVGSSKPQYALPTAPLPWVVDGEAPTGSATGSAGAASNPHSEVLLALKKLYPDPSQMPMELRTAMEKTEAQNSKQMTRDLHTATSQLGKAKRSLAEAKEARASHRKAWYAYLAECATVWKEQQKNFADHEQILKAQEEKSRLEIIQITSQIEQLTSTNAADSGLGPTTPVAPPVEQTEGLEDETEEKKLREAAQVALQSCLASVKEETETIQVDSENEEHPPKRARSEDPGNGPGAGQRASGGTLKST